MLFQDFKRNRGPLALLMLFLSIAMIFIALFVAQYCVCPLCKAPHDNGDRCQCTSLASHLFQSVFGDHEKHSGTMAKSTAPCEVRK